MIIVLRPRAPASSVTAIQDEVRSLGLEAKVSTGERGTIMVVIGDPSHKPLEDRLAGHPDIEQMVPVLAEGHGAPLISRRSFLDVLLAAVASVTALIGLGAAGAYLSRSGRKLGQASVLPVGSVNEFAERSSRLVNVQGRPIIVVRTHTEQYYALSAVCTHSEICQVHWDPRREQLRCPCHRAAFDVYGNVLHGPPPRPLRSLPVEIMGGQVYLRTGV